MTDEFEYDVALSFAGEDRPYVDAVANALAAMNLRVFYDAFVQVEAWGTELPEFFDDVFRRKARYAVVFVSDHYVRKPWARYEHRSAVARSLIETSPYLLPVRLDDSELPGLRPTVHYIDGRSTSPTALARLIEQKVLGRTGAVSEREWRVPRTREDQAALLQARPDHWEYLLFASELLLERERLEPKYRDHHLGYVRPGGPVLKDASNVASFLSDAMARTPATGNVERLLSNASNEWAFGRPGEPGDPDRIKHLAHRVVSLYEAMIDWSADVRSARASDEFRRVVDLASRLSDCAIEEVRAFIDETAATLDRLPEMLADDSDTPLHITLELVLTADDGLIEALSAEIDRHTPRWFRQG